MSALSTASPAETIRERRRVVFSSYLGTTIEFYDFLLYATASAVVFGPVFFSDLDPWAGAIAAYGTFAAGYLARPLGGVVFGHFGDRIGRKKLLVISMLIMGLASTAIGLVPSPDTIGTWAAVILVLLRVIQGIAIGGEWGGAALMALEHADAKKRGFAASFTNAGAPTGSVLGLLVMSLLGAAAGGVPGLGLACPVPALLCPPDRGPLRALPRLRKPRVRAGHGPPGRAGRRNQGLAPGGPDLQVLRKPGLLVTVILAATSAFALQTLLSTFAISYTVSRGTPQPQVMLAFAAAGIISIGTTLLAGRLSDRFGRKRLMITGNVLFILVLPAVFALPVEGNILLIFLAFTLGIVTQTVLYGPMAAFIGERFGTTSRYTGASMGYQIATLLGAGFTPLVWPASTAGEEAPPRSSSTSRSSRS